MGIRNANDIYRVDYPERSDALDREDLLRGGSRVIQRSSRDIMAGDGCFAAVDRSAINNAAVTSRDCKLRGLASPRRVRRSMQSRLLTRIFRDREDPAVDATANHRRLFEGDKAKAADPREIGNRGESDTR